MAAFQGLYYPYVHFQDDGWLKGAALYWDWMSRIVPEGVQGSDSDVVKRLVDSGFVLNQSPWGPAEKVAKSFEDLLNNHGEALSLRMEILESTPDSELVSIFDEKIQPSVLQPLLELRLARQRSRLIAMRPQLAKVYMVAMAEEMARLIGARPIAEHSSDHIAVSGLTLDRLANALIGQEPNAPARLRQDAEIEQAMATLAFRHVLPADLSSIPVEKLIEFRSKFAEERCHFQTEVVHIVHELDFGVAVEDPAEVQRVLENEYNKRLEGPLRRLEEGMNRVGWDTVQSALGVSCVVPAVLAAGLDALHIGSPPVLAGVGIAFGLSNIYRSFERSVAEKLKPSPEAYLYRTKTVLSPRAIIDELGDGRGQYLPSF